MGDGDGGAAVRVGGVMRCWGVGVSVVMVDGRVCGWGRAWEGDWWAGGLGRRSSSGATQALKPHSLHGWFATSRPTWHFKMSTLTFLFMHSVLLRFCS